MEVLLCITDLVARSSLPSFFPVFLLIPEPVKMAVESPQQLRFPSQSISPTLELGKLESVSFLVLLLCSYGEHNHNAGARWQSNPGQSCLWEGNKEGRRGQDAAHPWGGVPRIQPWPPLSSWWDPPRQQHGGDAVELSHSFGKLKAVGTLRRAYFSVSAVGFTRFSLIGTSRWVCFLPKVIIIFFSAMFPYWKKHTPAPGLCRFADCISVKPRRSGREHVDELCLVQGCCYLTLSL